MVDAGTTFRKVAWYAVIVIHGTHVVRHRTTGPRGRSPGSAPGHRPHGIQPDDDRRTRIERKLVAYLATTEQLAQEPTLPWRQAHEHAAAVDLDERHVVLGAVD